MNTKITAFFGLSSLAIFTSITHGAVMTDFTSLPPSQITTVDPNVMINLSVETPMQGAAYNDQNDGGSCSGRPGNETGPSGTSAQIGTCYFPAQTYIGIFDSNKCYVYSGNYFSPSGATGANHTCTGKWSGNLLNWATMTAIDEFRWTMTGGNRYIDTATETVLERANMSLREGHSWFPVKKISNSVNVSPSTVTPYSNGTLYITSYDYRIRVGTTSGDNNVANNLFVRAKVCDSSQGLEANCQPYGSNYKPEGLMQQNSKRMRFAVMSYLNNATYDRDGGVLRTNMKYVGPEMPATGGGLIPNPEAEWDLNTGVFIANPNPADAAASSVTNSGAINYINKFGRNGYKSYDPIGELYYECLNYFKNRGPTAEYSSGATATEKDDFPVITSWNDPIQHSCQLNYIVGINDANPWLDKQLPGSSATCPTYSGYTWSRDTTDCGNPSNADPAINVTSLTDTVGDLQGITGNSFNVGCVSGNCDMNASNSKTISNLGKAFGTAPWAGKENSYYIAGLAYYARSKDIRSDASLPGRQSVITFMIDTQEYNSNPLTGQMNMLWLAGKYGGFNEIDKLDTNGDSNVYEPNLAAEWDADGDGEPDNYVLANNPQKLVAGLTRAFKDISDRISAGSAAAVVGSTANGTGAIVQALYRPKVNNTGKKQRIEWAGLLHGIFHDEYGNLREDNQSSGTQGKLDNFATDMVIKLFYDTSVTPNRTRVQRYATTDGVTLTASGTPFEISQLGVIWNARDLLAETSANMSAQRSYTTAFNPAGSPRYIFSGIDSNKDGKIISSETLPFTDSSMSAYYRYFDTTSSANAQKIVNFIRGVEGISGFRSRTIDYDGDGTDEAWRLGDIIHSSPTVVGPPASNYDTLYGDTTYKQYVNQYKNRRQVAYVGGNDGMLHAFNMGFYDVPNRQFNLTNTSETQHPLGAELWAYVPANLLPHLQWLTDKQYSHVAYVDGPVQQFDVNIFTASTTHPGGWGTIIVAGMRFGGGPIDLDTNGDGSNDYTTGSAYIIMDVTDPESPPVLLAEITKPDLGYTTSLPNLVSARLPKSNGDWTAPSANFWQLAIGSGPTDLVTATSNQNARLYGFNLATNSFITGLNPLDLGISNSFVGNIATKDWDNDWVDDFLYFGLVEGTVSSPDGRVLQLATSGYTVNTLFDTPTGQPVVGRPTFSTDELGNGWVYFGTGRLFVRSDNLSSPQQALYGIKDPVAKGGSASTINISNLQKTTGVTIQSNGTLTDPATSISPALPSNTFSELQNRIATKDGWYREFSSASPSQRSITNPAAFFGFLLATSYKPNADICVPEGNSYLHALYYKTGTAYPDAGLGNVTVSGNTVTLDNVDLGYGIASDVIIISNAPNASGKATVGTNMSTGALPQTPVSPPTVASGRQSWREIIIQ